MTRPEGTAFLRALPGHGFAPPDGAVPGGDAVEAFAAAVRAFAAEFWATTPAERRARWDALTARATGPAAAWLADLGDALDVTPAALPDPTAAEVAALARELVVLPPRARAARRSAWLSDRAADFTRWRTAARTARRTDSSLADLEPRLFAALGARRPPARVALDPWVEYQTRVRARRLWADRITSAAGSFAALLFAGSIVMIFFIASTTPRPSEGPALRVPPPRARVVFTGEFSVDEVGTLTAYEREPRDGPVPPRYGEWVRAGRPAGEIR